LQDCTEDFSKHRIEKIRAVTAKLDTIPFEFARQIHTSQSAAGVSMLSRTGYLRNVTKSDRPQLSHIGDAVPSGQYQFGSR